MAYCTSKNSGHGRWSRSSRRVARAIAEARVTITPADLVNRRALIGGLAVSATALAAVSTTADALEKQAKSAAAVARAAEINVDIAALGGAPFYTKGDRERALSKRLNALRRQLRAKEKEVSKLKTERAGVVTKLATQTVQSIQHAENVIAMTGLNPDDFAPQKSRSALQWYLSTATSVFGFDARGGKVTGLSKQLDRWRKLQSVLRSLPLIAPLDHYRKSSNFGTRLHPITRRQSKHHGTDFAYYRGAPVLATAAGTVVVAGRTGAYGNLIEIDHGNGIRTRYAHSQEILVKKGDKVNFRDKIAMLGTTGRSTGPHVHYEILVKGRPVDPMKFIMAGKYAFKVAPVEQVAGKTGNEKPAKSTRSDAKTKSGKKPSAASVTLATADVTDAGAAAVAATAKSTTSPVQALPRLRPNFRAAKIKRRLRADRRRGVIKQKGHKRLTRRLTKGQRYQLASRAASRRRTR